MGIRTYMLRATVLGVMVFFFAPLAHADTLSLTSGSNATTTPSVATSITGFQIIGNAASTTPVKIHVTNGTVHATGVSGVTISGNDSATLNLSGTVANLNTVLSTLTYTRSSTGTDTLEVALVNSDQIYFPTNGHVYQYVSNSTDWNTARTAAQGLSAYGATGYLVTITSSAENDFVKARLAGNAWIGASDSVTEGDWKWVTGPEAGISFWSGAASGHTVGGNYASWNGGEPNDSGGNEDCGEEYVADGTWNDLPCSGSSVDGYVAEFGTDTSPATVVSKNVSIVTADVPAITSLSPSNGAINVSTTTNLVIGFSKTVTKDTGNILIKRTSDDTTIETIDASGSQISGSGTNTITIDPNANLSEGVGYYVIIPGTAFKDGSNNHFNGISDKTTWAFSVPDLTPPVITSIATSSIATTSALVSWTTNEAASSKIVYSAGTSYASTTLETDTGSRVTSHAVMLSGLVGCVNYNFKVVSSDASGNYATSTSNSFTTIGCPGSAAPSSTVTTPVTVSAAATSTLADTGRTLTVATQANFTATSSSVTIQIKGMSSNIVLSSIGTPSSALTSAANIVFDVTALIDNTTTLDSFNTPVTISYTYTDADVAGLDENSLAMYHYHGGVWLKLDACTIDTAANKITCNTPSFSTFAIFGTASVTSNSNSLTSSGFRSGGSIQSQVANLIAMGNVVAANALKAKWPRLFPPTAIASTTTTGAVVKSAFSFARDLTMGSTGADVAALQRFLNTHGFPIAATGTGSSGNETIFFGALTKTALMRYQKSIGVAPVVGYFGPLTRARVTQSN